jgi:hypothetical protein
MQRSTQLQGSRTGRALTVRPQALFGRKPAVKAADPAPAKTTKGGKAPAPSKTSSSKAKAAPAPQKRSAAGQRSSAARDGAHG